MSSSRRPPTATPDPGALGGVLRRAQELGFLGPAPVEDHLRHAAALAGALGDPGAARCLDLGSGAGLPGLPLAVAWPGTSWVLLDAGERRCAALADAVERLGLGVRVEVRQARAEEAGRDAALRGTFDLVVARAFGPPAVVAECGAPFLRVGGRLAVTEPPGAPPTRWPDGGVDLVGLALGDVVQRSAAGVRLLHQVEPCPDRYPRRTGVPTKRPLF